MSSDDLLKEIAETNRLAIEASKKEAETNMLRVQASQLAAAESERAATEMRRAADAAELLQLSVVGLTEQVRKLILRLANYEGLNDDLRHLASVTMTLVQVVANDDSRQVRDLHTRMSNIVESTSRRGLQINTGTTQNISDGSVGQVGKNEVRRNDGK